MIPHWFAPHGVSAYEDLARRIEVIYGTPANLGAAPLTAPPVVVAAPPKSNIKVLEQLVGATVLRLENGDVVNMRVFVDEMTLNENGIAVPVVRIVPEVVLRGGPAGVRHDVSGETSN